jgi:enamine deaminase RidA (YjgF/YER057c/UK114 family)
MTSYEIHTLVINLKALEMDMTDENMNISYFFFLQAAALPKGAKVEIEAIAMVGEIIDENL